MGMESYTGKVIASAIGCKLRFSELIKPGRENR
jgi:hypothetical protein